jgi:DNA mismatch repair protein MutL
MADIIQLLPDSIANQIAAGEVVQRPASAVKELMENSIDAGATKIQLILKDAGRTLIQVIDNGVGMSETDARMCFERHATSKIRRAEDLFELRTMGFRGEALASIAAVAQVELKTKKANDEVGVRIVIEGSVLLTQEADSCPTGSNLSIKNLFFNIPARRNFLKDNKVELKHIVDEFHRVALANPDIHFTLHHNGVELYHLTTGNLKQRIIGVFGQSHSKNLVPVQEETDVVSFKGFVGKPEFAKKSRGEQLFFINNRFIKSSYLHHAVMNAYEDVMAKDSFPFYVIMMEIDPSRIDVNVHPTKTEIKFDDERVVYNYLKVAVRHALGQYSVTPTLDFESDTSFLQHSGSGNVVQTEEIYMETLPSRASQSDGDSSRSSYKDSGLITGNTTNFKSPERLDSSNLRNWQQLYAGLEDEFSTKKEDNGNTDGDEEMMTIKSKWDEETPLDDSQKTFSEQQKEPYQLHNTYIIKQVRSGFMLIDQQAAHERILYEKYLKQLEAKELTTQTELFPKTITLPPADAHLMKGIIGEVNHLGFDIQEFGQNTFVIHGKPVEMQEWNEKDIIETLLEQYKLNVDLNLDIRENLAQSMARSASIKRGRRLSIKEMRELIDQLFACEYIYSSPGGTYCFIEFELLELKKKFEVK